MDGQFDIVIIGGGMAGLSAATALAKTGASVTVLDKGRGPGGRMAARRVEIGGEQVSFDHGAQYLTARDPAFR
jgi:renalase